MIDAAFALMLTCKLPIIGKADQPERLEEYLYCGRRSGLVYDLWSLPYRTAIYLYHGLP